MMQSLRSINSYDQSIKLLCLRFYATGCTQLTVADFSGVAQPTACRIIHKVSEAIASLYEDHIYLPRTQAEISTTQCDFYEIARFPKVIGALDCTHIKIKSPGGVNAEYFRNRKGFFSINCQVICDANLQILDLVARWPGSAHDATIIDHCRQRAFFEDGRYGDSLLLGDSAYPSRSYLMAPLPKPSRARPEEVLYNEAHIRTRNPVERIFGAWKRRFPILVVGINTLLENALPIIVATGVLYNILERNGDPVPPDDEMLPLSAPWEEIIDYGQVDYRNANVLPDRNQHGRALINDYFRT